MDVIRVDAHEADPRVVERAVAALLAGELLIYPTDTLYALGGRAHDPDAARRVRQAKGRETKPLPLIAADLAQAQSLASAWPGWASRLAERFWPGPLTLVLAGQGLPVEVTAGGGSVAVRVPALALARQLCRQAGPLVSTSANLSGQSPALTCTQAVAAVGDWAALALDSGPGRPLPSTVVDLTGAGPRLVRAGVIGWDEIERVLR